MVAITTAAGLVPLLLGVGIAVDTARLALAKAALQDAVDAAALAGAAAYQTPASTAVATAAAYGYFKSLTANATGAFTVQTVLAVPTPGTNAYSQPSYNVTVTAKASMPTTFMALAGIGTLPLFGEATAANPLVQPVITLGSVGSDAADWNSIYLYAVPMANGQPNFDAVPPIAQWYEIGSNCGPGTSDWTSTAICNGQTGATVPASQAFPAVAANQPLAFVFKNVTEGTTQVSPTNTYNYINSYGASTGSIQVLLTLPAASGNSPSAYTDESAQLVYDYTGVMPNQPATNYSKTNNTNCALVIQQVDPNNLPTSPPIAGQCFAVNDVRAGLQYANLSCAQIAGRTFMYWWNDMGGRTDDVDYNDFYYTLSCGSSNSGPNGGTFAASSGSQTEVALVQ